MMVILTGVRWYFNIILIYKSLIISDVEYLMYHLAICMSWEKTVFKDNLFITRKFAKKFNTENKYTCFSSFFLYGLLWWLSWERICLQYARPGFDPWIGKIHWKREQLPSQVFWPGESHGLYSPWLMKGQTQLNDFNFHFSFSCT